MTEDQCKELERAILKRDQVERLLGALEEADRAASEAGLTSRLMWGAVTDTRKILGQLKARVEGLKAAELADA